MITSIYQIQIKRHLIKTGIGRRLTSEELRVMSYRVMSLTSKKLVTRTP